MMVQSILFKELRKTWRSALALAAGNAVAAGHVWLGTRLLFQREHAEVVWYQAMQLGLPFYHTLKYLPLATGAALAVAQFVPEMRQERLRLSLHLPVGLAGLMLAHLAAGLAGLAVCLALQATGLVWGVAAWFPQEMVGHVLGVWTSWALAGVAGYLGVAFALLEPTFGKRVANLLLAAGAAWLFLLPVNAGQVGVFSSQPVLSLLTPLVVLALLALAVLHSAGRYRNRRVDR